MIETKVTSQKALDNEKVFLQSVLEVYQNDIMFAYDRIHLPHLSDEELLSLYKKIKPIIRINDLDYYYLKRFKLLRNHSCISDYKHDNRGKIDTASIEVLDEFPCYHDFRMDCLVTPSIAEVLEQFPDDLSKEANAFCAIIPPKDDFETPKQIEALGYKKTLIRAIKIKRHN